MKRVLSLLFLSSLVFTFSVQSQDVGSKHELRLGVGFISSTDVMDIFSDFLATSLTAGHYSVDNKKMTGNYSLTYRNHFSERLSLGGTLLYSQIDTDVLLNGTKNGDSRNRYFTLAPEFELKYLKTNFLNLYGYAGAGMTLLNQKMELEGKPSEKDDKMFFNFQLSPICLQVGNSFGLLAEAGFGYKGVINVGLFAKF